MPHAYTEEQLVERPAMGLFSELGSTTVSAVGEFRETSGILQPALLSGPMRLDCNS